MLGKGSKIQQLHTYSALLLFKWNPQASNDLLKKLANIISLIFLETDFLNDLSNLIKLWHEETCLAHEYRGCQISKLLACPSRLAMFLDN